MSDLISRQAAIDAVHKEFDDCIVWDESGMTTANEVEKILDSVPSAQPDLDEWCTDCKEYDPKRHSCPRYNRVIREALNGAEPRKPGRWNFIGDNMFECTSCGVVYTTEQLNGLRNYDTDPYAPRFCPSCGADMRENMKDLIDREKALDCFHDWVDKYGDVHTADEMTEYQAIETLPTEKSPCALCQYNDLECGEEPCKSCTMGGENNHFKAVERWIPCSERLPEIKEYHVSDVCIVYCENGAYGFAELEENIFGQVGWNCERDDEYHEPLGNVLAWMPLPEPYEGEE